MALTVSPSSTACLTDGRHKGRTALTSLGWLALGLCFSIPAPGLPSQVSVGLLVLMVLQFFYWRCRISGHSRVAFGALATSIIAYAVSFAIHGMWPTTYGFLAAIIFGATMVGLLYLYDPGGHKKLNIVAGFCLGWIIQDTINPVGNAAVDVFFLWKYSIAVPVTLVALLWAAKAKGRIGRAAVILMVLGLVSLFANFRSHGGICLVTAGVLLSIHLPQAFVLSKTLRNFLSVCVFLLLLLPLIFVPRLIDSGFFGEKVQQKNIQQGELGPWFLAGRTEPALSYAIVSERPFFGWGSVGNVPGEIVRNGVEALRAAGFVDVSAIVASWYRNGEEVLLHSVLAQYWVEAGVFSIVFFLIMICYAWRAAFRSDSRWMPVLMFFAGQYSWDLLFSPYTYRLVPLWSLMFVVFVAVQSRRTDN